MINGDFYGHANLQLQSGEAICHHDRSLGHRGHVGRCYRCRTTVCPFP